MKTIFSNPTFFANRNYQPGKKSLKKLLKSLKIPVNKLHKNSKISKKKKLTNGVLTLNYIDVCIEIV